MGSNRERLPRRLNDSPFQNIMQQMDHFFQESMKNFDSLFQLNSFHVDMFEDDTNVVIEADLQGYKREQIQIKPYGNHLKIAVENSSVLEEQNENTSYIHQQQTFQRMERLIALPFQISEIDTRASFKEGLLTITIPKDKTNSGFIDIDG
ncbi:HSP20 family protein [Salinibacillus kushneri]|uniref:HSP20 family protein n=1 Tax=Salinibacillus kushneri TaxID=237682 RepID=A0A1I0FA52_9BACI|nr:Hsp20/alpha crystallin family protein [Salinibacillus kushneri]SET54812.1 HSP20 family protein [Salinibacillus kushneri]